jgi:hypothetical protein
MKSRGILFSVLFVATILFTGCQYLDNNPAGEAGRLVIKVTDAPFPIDLIEEALVTITKVEMRSKNDTIGYPFLTVFEGSAEFNLMELRNGLTEQLASVDIPSGDYDLIRLYVDKASITVKEQGTFSVKVPSGAETGIKIFIEPGITVMGGLTAELLLDFNLEKSFVLQGNMNSPAGIKGFIFKPVIRAVNNTRVGVVQGIVMDAGSATLENASVWIYGDTLVNSSFTDAEGFYALLGIPAGLYSMSAVKEGFDTITVTGVTIVEGNLTVQDFTLEPAAE